MITGATGFLGQRITRMVSGKLPNLPIMAMSRSEAIRNEYVHSQLAKHENLEFVQYDCTSTLAVPQDILQETRCMLHLVGGLRRSHLITRTLQELATSVEDNRDK